MKKLSIILIFSLIFNLITPNLKSILKLDSFQSFAEDLNNLRADGFASQNGGTTGGKGGQTVTVSSYKDFKAAVQSKDAKIVIVQGTIKTTDGEGYGLKVQSNKTIMGKDKKATIYGGLSISGVKNVILYNINIQGSYPNLGPGNCIDISNGSTNVWVHHVSVWDADDGNIDIKGKANYITVSYCKFYYINSKNPHILIMEISKQDVILYLNFFL